MDRSTRILIVARPGHRRQSLVALLKTLNRAELFLIEDFSAATTQPPHLVLVDLGGVHPLSDDLLKQAAQEWPAARKLVLVDDIRQTSRAYSLGADFALGHNTPAGELLLTVKQLSQETQTLFRIGVPSIAIAGS
jgi:DNA-binding NarL/FixJ family response regulator